MSKKIFSLLLVLVLLFTFAACGETAKEDPIPVEDPEPVVPEVIHYYNRFNGEECTEEESKLRGYAVMINNHKAAQPLLSMASADLIFEMPVEGGITRFMAVYSNPKGLEEIGSVRSSRKCFLDMLAPLDCNYVHAGGSDEAYALMEERNVDHVDGVKNFVEKNSIFWRDAERKKTKAIEHTLVTSGDKMIDYFASNGYRTTSNAQPVFNFQDTSSAANGQDAKEFSVKFSAYKTGYYEYDEASKLYKLSQFGDEMADGLTGDVLAVKNVFVLVTDTETLNDEKHHVDVRTTGSGDGYYICEGKYIPITWSRNSYTDTVVYKESNGADVQVLPGLCYVNWISKKNAEFKVK